uniref:Uncharacterized protein n=1 Tax=Timema shepardi TaxID=629360 RepID=A0A7R9AZF4_TIMSH|nr:unnamed protein product [Timema shepardi]
MASLVLTDSSQLTIDSFKKLPDQMTYPYAEPDDLLFGSPFRPQSTRLGKVTTPPTQRGTVTSVNIGLARGFVVRSSPRPRKEDERYARTGCTPSAVSGNSNNCYSARVLKARGVFEHVLGTCYPLPLSCSFGSLASRAHGSRWITALERGRKVEELQKRLVESEMLRTRYNRKVTLLKDQQQTITPQYIAALANIGLKRPRVNFPNPEPSRAYRGKKESDKCDLTALCQPRSANTQDCSFACIWRRGACHVIVCSRRMFDHTPLSLLLFPCLLRAISQSADQERALNEHNHQILREELTTVKQSLMDCQRRENALLSFRTSVMKLLGLETPLPDYEVISRLQKVVQAHRDFTLVSRRYEDPLLMGGGSRTPLLLGHSPAGTRTPRYDDSGFVDPPDLSVLDDSDEVNGGGVYGKRGVRSSP